MNGISDDGSKAIGSAIAMNSTLIELDLKNNRIGEKGAMDLINGILKNDSVRALRVFI